MTLHNFFLKSSLHPCKYLRISFFLILKNIFSFEFEHHFYFGFTISKKLEKIAKRLNRLHEQSSYLILFRN